MRLRNSLTAALTAALLVSAPVGHAEPGDRLQQLRPIALDQGPNLIENFAGDGRTAMIVLGWRDNGNAHGYDVFLTLMPTTVGGRDWNVVGVDGPDGALDVVKDAPHVGEDMTRSVRFAKGVLDGRPSTLLLIATREFARPIGAASRTKVEVFSLRANTDGPGNTRDYFEPVWAFRTERNYCNAEMALQTELGLVVSPSYEGSAAIDGC